MKSKLVGQVMTREVEFVEPAASVREAAGKMKSLDVSSLPVADGGRLVGVVTDREIALKLAAEGKDPTTTAVRDIMNPSPAFLKEDDPASSIPRAMEEKSAHLVFVVDKEGKLAGIVSLGKLARSESEKRAGQVVKRISKPRKRLGA